MLLRLPLVSCALLMLGACSHPDRVLFVTSSSLGINVDNKPPTVAIAYDRAEGYIGPVYENGAMAPVVGSIATGGTIFSPKVRQIYATGAASLKAVKDNVTDGPSELSGDPNKKRMTFFGTTTTIGLKAGFGTSGVPDSLTFGYKRKEFSFLPLQATTVNGKTVDVYPSVLASIDSSTNISSLEGTGLSTTQFFATGATADALADNAAIKSAFKSISQEATTSSLTPEDLAKAKAAGATDRQTQDTSLNDILNYVAPNQQLDKAKLSDLVDKANAKAKGSVPEDLKQASNVDAIRNRIGNAQVSVRTLHSVLPATKTQ